MEPMISRLGSGFALRETFSQWRGSFWIGFYWLCSMTHQSYLSGVSTVTSFDWDQSNRSVAFLITSRQQQQKQSIDLLPSERKNENEFLIRGQHFYSRFIRRVSRVKSTVGPHTSELGKKTSTPKKENRITIENNSTWSNDWREKRRYLPAVAEIAIKNSCKCHKMALTDWKAESNKMTKANEKQGAFQ